MNVFAHFFEPWPWPGTGGGGKQRWCRSTARVRILVQWRLEDKLSWTVTNLFFAMVPPTPRRQIRCELKNGRNSTRFDWVQVKQCCIVQMVWEQRPRTFCSCVCGGIPCKRNDRIQPLGLWFHVKISLSITWNIELKIMPRIRTSDNTPLLRVRLGVQSQTHNITICRTHMCVTMIQEHAKEEWRRRGAGKRFLIDVRK